MKKKVAQHSAGLPICKVNALKVHPGCSRSSSSSSLKGIIPWLSECGSYSTYWHAPASPPPLHGQKSFTSSLSGSVSELSRIIIKANTAVRCLAPHRGHGGTSKKTGISSCGLRLGHNIVERSLTFLCSIRRRGTGILGKMHFPSKIEKICRI